MTRLDSPLTVRYGTPRQRAYVSKRASKDMPIEDRIAMHIEVADSGCWEWQQAPIPVSGYAGITINYKRYLVHRLTYELYVGPIPEGLHIDHLCRNRICVNPEHLEAVTPQINVLRGISLFAENAVKTHCPQGHPYSEENTYRHGGRRACRTCRKTAMDRYYARLESSGQQVGSGGTRTST